MRRLRVRITMAISAIACVGGLVIACGTDAIGVEVCRQVETARCLQAPNCGIDLSMPKHRGSPGTDVDACIRYYHDACLHGLATNTDPGNVQLQACIGAINSGNCDYVEHPEDAPECAWLIPPVTTTADASSDATDDGDATSTDDASSTGVITFDDAGNIVVDPSQL
jgi:hypothetical protein